MRTNLKILRVRHRMTQAEFADRIGITRATYSAIESGRRNGSRFFWTELKRTFGISEREIQNLKINEL